MAVIRKYLVKQHVISTRRTTA